MPRSLRKPRSSSRDWPKRRPGSSDPLLRGKIDSGLPSSVKPGESLSYSMYPMTGSSWDGFDPPDGVVVRLTPIGLSSIGQRNLAEARSPERLSKAEARLASLRSDLAELVPASR